MKAIWVFAVSRDTIASLEESVDGTAIGKKTTEKNGKSSLFPFFFRRFPATVGIDSPLLNRAKELISQSKSHSVLP